MGRPRKPCFRESDQCWVSMFHGRRVKLAKGRENQAEALKRFHELMTLEAVATPPESPEAIVAALCEAFLDWSFHNTEAKTYQFYRTFLQDFCTLHGCVRVADLKPFHVTRWLSARSWNVSTRRCAITAIKRVFNWGTDEGLIARNPLKSVKKPAATRRERVLTGEEDRQITGATDTAFRLVVLALRHTGMRPGELGNVLAKNVDLTAGTWTITKHKTRNKTGKPRVIYISPCLQTVSRILLSAHPSGPLFRNSRDEAWTANAIRCRMRRLREKLHLDRGSWRMHTVTRTRPKDWPTVFRSPP